MTLSVNCSLETVALAGTQLMSGPVGIFLGLNIGLDYELKVCKAGHYIILIEAQSTWNPNMGLRMFRYLGMLYEKYPCERFTPCRGITDLDTDKYAYLYDVTFYNVEAVYFNHYIMASKCIEISNPLYDNGRLVSADMVRLVICDVDFEIISKNYEFSDIFYHEIWKAKKDYLPRHYILYILELYNNKTKLKGVTNEEIPGAPELYQRSKSQLNSLFGCCCTNEIQATCDFSDGKWHTAPITDQIIADKLREKRHGYNNLFSYSTGVWITAWNRLRLFEKILDIPDLDTDVIYYDTDSLKIQNGEKYLPRFEAYNMEVDNKTLRIL